MTCVYEHVNFLHTQLYTKGEAASECDDIGERYTTSDMYPNLCVNNKSEASVSINEFFDLDDQQTETNENLSHYCQLEIEKCDGRRHIGCETDPGLEVE